MDDDPSEGLVWVHRDLEGEHVISRNCWCRPHSFTSEEFEAMSEDELFEQIRQKENPN